MKVRKIELQVLPTYINEDTSERGPDFEYRHVLRALLHVDQKGFSPDDVLKVMELWTSVKRASKNGRAVMLSNEDYQWLSGRLNTFQFATASEQLAQFIQDFRSAPQVDVEETAQDS